MTVEETPKRPFPFGIISILSPIILSVIFSFPISLILFLMGLYGDWIMFYSPLAAILFSSLLGFFFGLTGIIKSNRDDKKSRRIRSIIGLIINSLILIYFIAFTFTEGWNI